MKKPPLGSVPLPLTHTPMPPGYRPDTPPNLSAARTVFLDAETDGLDWAGDNRPVGWAVRADGESWYLPMRHKGGGNLAVEQVHNFLEGELKNKHIVNLNTRFDMHMSRSDGVNLDRGVGNTFEDIQHNEALLNDWERQFSLDATGKRRVGEGKLDPCPADQIHRHPAWDIADYAKQDVRLVDLVYQAQKPLIATDELIDIVKLESRVLPAVVEMEHNGVRIDVEKLDLWVRQSEACAEQMQFALNRKCGFQCNPDRDMDRLFKQRGFSTPHRTDTGANSYPGAYVQTVPDEVIQLAYKLGKLIDLRNKFLLPYKRFVKGEFIYGTFHQLMTGDEGTVSGRFSGVRPNLQQVMTPNKQRKAYGSFEFEWEGQTVTAAFIIKELFIPVQGRTWFSADAKQIEYRLFGHYSQAKAVLDAYGLNPDADYHQVVCDILRRFSPDVDRRRAKDVNFAVIYGAGIKKIAEMLGMTLEAAKAFLRIYDQLLPEAKATLNLAMRVAETRGYVRTILGRRVRFPSRQRLHKALNGVIQGGAADLNKLAIADVHENRVQLCYTPRITVHDELGGDLEHDDALPVIADFLNRQRFDLQIPILWDSHVGATWAEAKG